MNIHYRNNRIEQRNCLVIYHLLVICSCVADSCTDSRTVTCVLVPLTGIIN